MVETLASTHAIHSHLTSPHHMSSVAVFPQIANERNGVSKPGRIGPERERSKPGTQQFFLVVVV